MDKFEEGVTVLGSDVLCIESREYPPQVSEWCFYKAAVQAVLLFVSETWNLAPQL